MERQISPVNDKEATLQSVTGSPDGTERPRQLRLTARTNVWRSPIQNRSGDPLGTQGVGSTGEHHLKSRSDRASTTLASSGSRTGAWRSSPIQDRCGDRLGTQSVGS